MPPSTNDAIDVSSDYAFAFAEELRERCLNCLTRIEWWAFKGHTTLIGGRFEEQESRFRARLYQIGDTMKIHFSVEGSETDVEFIMNTRSLAHIGDHLRANKHLRITTTAARADEASIQRELCKAKAQLHKMQRAALAMAGAQGPAESAAIARQLELIARLTASLTP